MKTVKVVGDASDTIDQCGLVGVSPHGNPELRVHVQDPKSGMISKAYVVAHNQRNQQANENTMEHLREAGAYAL